ncbi:MAG: hypothetical protein ACYC91_09145 [Solirubrobacteraceae bacterium]
MKSSGRRETIGRRLILPGAVLLFASLFLTWSHQFSPGMLAEFGTAEVLRGVPHDPTAWQVYSTADVILAALAVGLSAVALAGDRRWRVVAMLAATLALAFTLHAVSAPPSNGANVFDPALAVPQYFPNSPGAGPGETLAILGLVIALAGLGLSVAAE